MPAAAGRRVGRTQFRNARVTAHFRLGWGVDAGNHRQRQIELFFKWIRQNLELKRFLANNPNAVRLQIITALNRLRGLRLLQQASRITWPLKRLRAVARGNLFNLSAIETCSVRSARNHPPPSDPLYRAFPGQ